MGSTFPHPWIRFVGDGVLKSPQFVDCNDEVIVVSEFYQHRITVLSWRSGGLISQFGSYGSGPGQLCFPRGVRLLVGCSPTQLIVADSQNNRLCVFKLNGEFVVAMGGKKQGLDYLYDVLECNDGFIVANTLAHNLVKVTAAGEVVDVFEESMPPGNRVFNRPSTLAALPDGGLVVREFQDRRFHVFHGLGLRVEWITACVSLARSWRV